MRPIAVRQNGESCIIRWTYRGQRYSITWGHWSDNPKKPNVDKIKLERCGQLIYNDCLLNEFDTSLYKYNCYLSDVTPVSYKPPASVEPADKTEPKKPPLLPLLEQRLQENYNAADYSLLKVISAYKRLIDTPDDARAFIKWLDTRKLKDSTKKRYLNTLKAIRKDLFGLITIKVAERPVAKPFTKHEVDRILNYLKTDKYYSHYHDFILFLFNSGCRPSEAIGLLWRDVDLTQREIHVYESLIRGDKGSTSRRKRKPTKTSKYRIIPINGRVYEILTSRPKGDELDLIFCSPNGLAIDDHSVSQRCWRKTLEALGIPHRPLYTCRSTFVSHCIASGMLPQEIATITGHSVDILYQHYLGSVRRPTLPEL